MKKTIMKTSTIFMLISLLLIGFTACGSLKNQGDKLRKANFKNKVKELKLQGWIIDSSTKTLELALFEHLEKINENPDLREFESNVSMCRSLNVCKANALSNALREYADLAGSVVKGKVATDMRNNASAMKPEEFDNFYAAYTRNVEAEIKGELIPSYSLVKENGLGKSYKMVFIVDEEKASDSRKRAMERALEETKLSIKYGLWIEKFVTEDPTNNKQ